MNKESHTIKKIGFYDSGLGGLFVMSAVYKKFPNYDYVLLADEKNLPYGTKTAEELLVYGRICLDFLIEHEKCDVVVVACNTLSATVYQTLEVEYRKTFPHVLLLDIITPTIDSLDSNPHISIFGTPRTILSHVYKQSIEERFPQSIVDEHQMPELASLIERGEAVEGYIKQFEAEVYPKPHTCIMACTHYGLVVDVFKKVYPACTNIITQDSIMADLLSFVLHKSDGSDTTQHVRLYITQNNPIFERYARELFPDVLVELAFLYD